MSIWRRRTLVRERLRAPGSYGAEFYSGLGMRGMRVFVKHYNSAFTGIRLDEYLRSKEIANIVVAGVSASDCIMATVTDAFFNEFEVYV